MGNLFLTLQINRYDVILCICMVVTIEAEIFNLIQLIDYFKDDSVSGIISYFPLPIPHYPNMV